jgi:hypothetical protein
VGGKDIFLDDEMKHPSSAFKETYDISAQYNNVSNTRLNNKPNAQI